MQLGRLLWGKLILLVLLCCGHGVALELSGTIVGLDKEGVPAQVWLVEEQGVRTQKTGGDGRFKFVEVEVGTIQVVALTKDGAQITGHTGFVVGDADLALNLFESEALDVRILNSKYAPQPGARINTIWMNGLFKVPVERLVAHDFPPLRTDDEGVLSIPYTPKGGGVGIVAEHYLYGRAIVDYIPVRGEREEVVLPEGFTQRGRVRMEGAPVAGAQVSAFIVNAQGQQNYGEAVTDEEGLYRMTLPKGVYQIGVRHPDYASPPPKAQPVMDKGMAPCDFDLLVPRYIHGRVVYPKKKPCAGAFIRYQLGSTIYAELFSDNEGRFTLRVPSEEGSLFVLPPAGFMTVELPVIEVGEGQWKEITLDDIEVKELPKLVGKILDMDKQPVANALIRSQNLMQPLYLVTDEAGNFESHITQVLLDDKVDFVAEHPERMQRREFTLNVRRPKEQEVQLRRFQANTEKREDRPTGNPLADFVGEEALAWDCSRWFNTEEALSLEDVRGKVVVLTFWGSFDTSTYGLSHLNEIRSLHHVFRDKDDVVFIGLHDATSTPIEVEDGIRALGVNFPVGLDQDPFVSFEKYGIKIIPKTILIDKAGRVRYAHPEGRLHELIKVLRGK